MEQKQVSCGPEVYDRLPPLSSKYPWLVAQSLESEEEEEGGGTTNQFFYTINNASTCHYCCRIPELVGRRIRGCFHGWVILSNDPHNVLWCLWNPMTSKIIQLPPLIFKDGNSESIAYCCLSSPPNDPCSVLLLTRNDKSTFVFCRIGRKRKWLKWTEMLYSKQLKRITGDGDLLSNLTCCNGKVYALNTDNYFATFLVQLDIVIKKREVVIKLLLFGVCPLPAYNQYSGGDIQLMKGSCTELFYIVVGFRERAKKKIGFVSLFKLDMTSVNWEIIDRFKEIDMPCSMDEVLAKKDLYQHLQMSSDMWEEVLHIKDAIFFVDFTRDYFVFYNLAISSELGGYIHIRSDMGNLIQSYNLKDKTIYLSSMPSSVLPTSYVSVWEFDRLEYDQGKAICTIDSKQVKHEIVVRLDDEVGSKKAFLLLNLPFDILEMIMELCDVVDYKNFRATCKRCHLAAPVTPLMRLQTYSPFLIELDNDRHFITFTHPMLGDKYFIRDIPLTMKDDRIRCSGYGWLLFYTDYRDLVFYNIFTNGIIELPYLDFYFGQVCISAPPTSPDCMVVGFFREDVYVHFIDRGPLWRKIHLGVDSSSMCFSTFHGRDIYVLCENGKLHVFKDLDKENYLLEQVVVETPRRGSKDEYFLTKYDQHLLLVIVEENGRLVEVFKLNDSTKEWEKMDDLGRYMICICDYSTCFCIEVKSGEMENKIYFPRFHSKNERMVFYSLETQMYHTFNGKNMDGTLGDLKGTYRCLKTQAWIEPSWS